MNATPARISKAKNVMAEVEGFCRHLVRAVGELEDIDYRPEMQAVIDEAKAHIKALRQARINL